MSANDDAAGWTFLTNHGHVLICLARQPDIRLRDVAAQVGITERAVQSIVGDLEDEGYIERFRVGRRNRYRLHTDRPMRHPVEHGHDVAELLDVLAARRGATPRETRTSSADGSAGAGSGGRGPSMA